MRRCPARSPGNTASLARTMSVAVLLGVFTPGIPLRAAVQAPPGPTFSRDIAPIIWRRCAECHRPDGAAPFSLLTFEDVRRRGRQIADAVNRGYMPPWMPDGDADAFVNGRRLSAAEIALLSRWVENGAAEGDPASAPPTPVWPDRWRIGTPDLVIQLPEYVVPATDASDVFRNFVVDVPFEGVRYVRGLELLPSNPTVHHANIFVDPTDTSKALDASDPSPGYAGLIPHTATFPEGHFLGWTPGQAAPLEPESLAWTLDGGSSLLVQIHLKSTGKPERIHPSIGLYFGQQPPTDRAVMLRLGRQDIDIPPGAARYVASDSFALPVDASVQALQAHSHYRARSVTAVAVLPDGERRSLLTIPRWDFNWQDVYRYRTPIRLPKGTTVSLEYMFDNSDANVSNPVRPATRAVWGFRSSDEMGDLWVQMTAASPQDRQVLEREIDIKMTRETIVGYETQIAVNPDYAPIRNDVAVLYMETGRPAAAVPHFEKVAALDPASPAAHFNLARALQGSGSADAAILEYQEALRLNPSYERAQGGLAEAYYLQAFGRDERGQFGPAAESLRLALAIKPDWADALSHLAWVLATGAGFDRAAREESVRLGERARDLSGSRDANILDSLAAAYASVGRYREAIETARAAVARAAAVSPDLVGQIEARLNIYRASQAVVRHPPK